ncbi:scavenger receptor class F member 1-like [Saccostrea cucullata]|uniref:scavenger receptor class F member 1-like n=1 Tax=Saccostrea cuccullata TaxID=36930 RepID=UPI002ED050BB
MATLWWIWLVLLPGVTNCYDNICEGNICTARQSSTRFGFPAERVIDKNIHQTYNQCAHTSESDQEAWVMVDLGMEYKIRNVVIYYRTEGTSKEAWKPYRLRQYSLEVHYLQRWIQCFKDNTLFPDIPSSIQNVSCKTTARYLRVRTTYDAPEDSLNRIAILEICEIQVYGCNIGNYGPNCKSCEGCENCDIDYGCPVLCSPHCTQGTCDFNGNCEMGCNAGYWGDKCNKKCPMNCFNNVCIKTNGYCAYCTNGFYGMDCRNRCGNCSSGSCYINDGHCSGDCNIGFYGNGCNRPCYRNCFNQKCRKDDGYCEKCKSGFYGDLCKTPCSPNCLQSACYRSNGACIEGCKGHWAGAQCNGKCLE